MKKEEAEAKARIYCGPDWFCPVIRSNCREDCLCYEKARTINTEGRQWAGSNYEFKDPEAWRVVPPSCSNHMITGEET